MSACSQKEKSILLTAIRLQRRSPLSIGKKDLGGADLIDGLPPIKGADILGLLDGYDHVWAW